MHRVRLGCVMLLCGALASGMLAQGQQQKTASSGHTTDIDVAVTYVAERAKIASADCSCFWLHGGSANVAFTFFHGLGIAANLTGEHAAAIQPGVDLDKVMFAMGPRYTYRPQKWKPGFLGGKGIALFGEGLVGGVHGFNSVFPSSSGVMGAASSLGVQAGGGMDVQLSRTVGIRAFEVDYVRSTLPNNADNVQHDFRLAAGISFHFRR